MATRVFADEELARLREFPEIGREELFRYFTLGPADLAFVAPQGRGASVRLGLAVILCSLPWLGFVPDKITAAPPVAVARLAEQLNVDAAQLRSHGRRAQTRSEHVRLVAQYLGWRAVGAVELKELDEFLLARAMEHDSPTLLFRLACEYLISARVIRPGPVTLVERVAHARNQAQAETYDRLAHELTPQRCAELDALLVANRPKDQLVVTKLDRLGHSLEHLIELSKMLQDRNVDLVVLDQGIDTSTAVGRMSFQILGAIAEFEHALMSERTRDGLAAARARGRTGGRKPKLGPRQVQLVKQMYDELDEHGKRCHTVDQIAAEFGVTRPTIYRHLNKTTL